MKKIATIFLFLITVSCSDDQEDFDNQIPQLNHKVYIEFLGPLISELSQEIEDARINGSSNSELFNNIQSNNYIIRNNAFTFIKNGYEMNESNQNVRIELTEFEQSYITSVNTIIKESSSFQNFSESLILFNNSLENLNLEQASFALKYSVLVELKALIVIKHLEGASSGRIEGFWDGVVDYFSSVGDCGAQVIEQIASSPELAAATTAATLYTGGAAAAYGMAGIALGCTVGYIRDK